LTIADLHLGGSGVRVIAASMGRSPSTISRELARNGATVRLGGRPPARPQHEPLPVRRRYAPYAAQAQAELRGRRPKASRFEIVELAEAVQSMLCSKWSPEQISVHLRCEFGGRAEMQVSPETIYQPCSCRAAGRCTPICTGICAPGGQYDAHAGRPARVRRPRRSRTWC
jgi:IS30 family transposase